MPWKDRPCGGCGKPVKINAQRADALRKGFAVYHKGCRAKRKREPQADRRFGVIVSAVTADGRPLVWHMGGKTYEALRVLCDWLPAGATIDAISTWRTIARDLQHVPRLKLVKRGGRGAHSRIRENQADPWSAERQLLSKVGRLDLLTPKARFPIRNRVTLEPRRSPTAHLFGRYER